MTDLNGSFSRPWSRLRRYALVVRRTRFAFVMMLLMGGTAWAIVINAQSSRGHRAGAPGPAPPDSPPISQERAVPVIIYLIDTLRADRLGAYGYTRGLTPHMDALARESVLFEQAYACSPWTLPSVASLFTSMFLTRHGIIELGGSLPESARPLGRRLTDRGYACAAFVSNPFAMAVVGTEWGYQPSSLTGKCYDLPTVEKWIAGVEKQRFHLFLHTTEPHNPFEAPDDFVRQFGASSAQRRDAVNRAMAKYRDLTKVDFAAKRPVGSTDNSAAQDAAMAELRSMKSDVVLQYDANIALADKHLGQFISMLKRRQVWDRCLFVLLADHGEELDEHGGWQHDQSLYEELTRVPLIVHFPGDEHAGRRMSEPVRLVDVMPTILDFIGARRDLAGCHGISLLGALADPRQKPSDQPQVVSVRINERKYYKPYKTSRGDVNIAIRTRDWKAIWNVEPGTLELYDLRRDPAERSNVAGENAPIARKLLDFAAAWKQREGRVGTREAGKPLDPEAARRLRTLGYIGDDH